MSSIVEISSNGKYLQAVSDQHHPQVMAKRKRGIVTVIAAAVVKERLLKEQRTAKRDTTVTVDIDVTARRTRNVRVPKQKVATRRKKMVKRSAIAVEEKREAKARAKARARAEAKVGAKAGAKARARAVVEIVVDPKGQAAVEANALAGARVGGRAEAKVGSRAEAKAEVEAKVKDKAEAGAKNKAEVEVE